MSYLEWLDIRFFYLINHDLQNGVFDFIMPLITDRDNWWPLIALVSIYLLFFEKTKGKAAFIVTVAAVGFSDFTASSIIKPLVERIRPCNMLEGVNILVSCSKSYSFPSSHAANIAAVAVAGSFYYRRAIIPLFVLALAVGYSRIYVGVHYPLDVLAGGIVGSIIASGMIYMERRFWRGRDEECRG